jgi:hypothetical protein
MLSTTIDKKTDRRLMPERRRYSYARHIPERRGTTTESAFGKPKNTAMRGAARESENLRDHHSKKKDDRPRYKHRPKTIFLKKDLKLQRNLRNL